MHLLAGDIGGTNARLALVELEGSRVRILDERRYPSQSATGLAPIVATFLRETGATVERAGFGIAGPVIDGVGRTSNLPWVVDERALAADLGIPHVVLVNDFAAVGHGVPWLASDDYVTLQAGEPVPHAPIALIGAGTGLGEGYLIWTGTRYQVLPSEGGHVSYCAQTEEQWIVQRALAAVHHHVSAERVLSGQGLATVYDALATAKVVPENPEIREEMAQEDPAAVVSRHALAGDDPLCERALSLFLSVYGSEAGDLVLTVLARGGVFVAGGIAPRILPAMARGEFIAAFTNKGRLRPILEKTPVHVITTEAAALLGAAAVAAVDVD